MIRDKEDRTETWGTRMHHLKSLVKAKPFHALTFQGEPEQSALQENPPTTPQGSAIILPCILPFSLPPFLFWFREGFLYALELAW